MHRPDKSLFLLVSKAICWVLLCLLCNSSSLLGQNEIKNWYFGTGTDGIIFSNGIPQKVNNKYPSVGFEGMIVVNDPVTGDLKFYSDGQRVINSNHQVMTNGTGLTGHSSGAQTVQCCPVPGSCAKKFYLFSNSGFDLTGGKISYSIVDFTTNPLGVVTNKNTLFWNGPSDEAMCLINKPNSNDYWLISNQYQTANYYVWPITGAGIGAPTTYSFASTGSSYQMNFSKTAGKIVVTGYGNKHVATIDFNSNTGVLSNEIQLGNAFGTCYPARFSPDGSKLYVGTTPSGSPITTPTKLYQYDLSNSVWTDMSTIGACCYAHDLKMGPDGKMYHIHTYNASQPIAVMDYPDRSAVGNACGYSNVTFPDNFNGEVRRFPEFVTLPSPPTAISDTALVDTAPISIDVLANDYDYDLQSATISIDAIEYGPVYGTAIISGNKIQYTPGNTSCVIDTLIYRIKGLDCATDTAYLIVKKPGVAVDTFLDTAICEGQNYRGHTASGVYKDTLKSVSGCDSVVTAILTVKQTSFSAVSVTICEGDNYNGHTVSGTYYDTLTSFSGCDSIITINLTVAKKYFSAITIKICEGESYNGHLLTGIYTDTLVTTQGCDSIITVNLTVAAISGSSSAVSICEGENYNGHTLPGVYVDTLTNVAGCDSIATITLTVLQRSFFFQAATICEGDDYNGHKISGTYSDTLMAANGCDSIVSLELIVIPATRIQIDTAICEGQSYLGYSAAGIYFDTLMAAGGCDSVRELRLTLATTPLPNLGQDKEICTGDSIVLSPGQYPLYNWQDGSTNDQFTVKHGGVYSVTVGNSCGQATDAIVITEQSCNIYFPSAFTPNRDGLNDRFRILNAFGITDYYLAVYNRWGEKIFETTDYTKGWDGMVKGHEAPTGNFVWFSKFRRRGVEVTVKGNVLLIR